MVLEVELGLHLGLSRWNLAALEKDSTCLIFILGVGLSVGADSAPCSVSDNQLEHKQPILVCIFSNLFGHTRCGAFRACGFCTLFIVGIF